MKFNRVVNIRFFDENVGLATSSPWQKTVDGGSTWQEYWDPQGIEYYDEVKEDVGKKYIWLYGSSTRFKAGNFLYKYVEE